MLAVFKALVRVRTTLLLSIQASSLSRMRAQAL